MWTVKVYHIVCPECEDIKKMFEQCSFADGGGPSAVAMQVEAAKHS